MSTFYLAPTANFVTKKISGTITDSQTTITLDSTTNLQAPGVIVVDRVDSTGVTLTPNAREVIAYTGISGNDLTGCTRGFDNSTARTHADQALVETAPAVGMWNNLATIVASGLDSNGLLKAISSAVSIARIESRELAVISTASIASGFFKTRFDVAGASVTGLTPSSSLVLNPPRGYLINGKIAVSVASSDLTVAIKGLDGNDPSASNPVYCRIGDTVRTITSALSVTKNDGTNWFNAGGAETATLEIDYFAYLGYNATDGVVLGFSRLPNARQYSDFSATTTNDRYAAISTITTAAATDFYENIGRFAATLSAGAGYTWTVPTFTAINLIQRPIYETRWLSWTPTWTGSGSLTVGTITNSTRKYRIQGNQLFLTISSTFTTGGTTSASVFFTVPMTMQNQAGQEPAGATKYNDGGGSIIVGFFDFSSTTQIQNRFVGATWTVGVNAGVHLSTSYEV